MDIPSELYYTRNHEWLRREGEEAVVGITDYAQGELGDIVYIDLPEVGADLFQGKPFGAVEAVKAAADLFAPVSGEVTEVNGLLNQAPELINQSPYKDGWIIRIRISDPGELDTLLSAGAYHKLIEQTSGS